MGAYEDFCNSERIKKAVDSEVKERRTGKASRERNVADMLAFAEAEKAFKDGKGSLDKYVSEYEIEMAASRKLWDKYFMEKAEQLRAARKNGLPKLTPEMERAHGGALYHAILDEQASRIIDEELKNNPPDLSQHKWFQRKVDNYLDNLHFDAAVEKKIASMEQKDMQECMNAHRPFFRDEKQNILKDYIAKMDMNDRVADPKMRDTLTEIRLDTYEAQARIETMKKEGQEAPHINVVFAQVRQERKADTAAKTANVITAAVAAKRTR